MKKLKLILVISGLLLTIISSGQTNLTYNFANPRIIRVAGFDNFEFDVQVKADAAGTYLWSGQVILNFDNITLSTTATEWTVIRAAALTATNSISNQKYGFTRTITGTTTKVLNIALTGDANVFSNGPNADDFVEITTSYQTLVTVRGRITSTTGVAGLTFIQSSMNGQQSFVSGASAFTNYVNPNLYDPANFNLTYVGRTYSGSKGWSQVGNSANAQWVDWTAAVNTSVWDGAATIPTTGESKMGALRIHSPSTLTIPSTGQLTCTNSEFNTAQGLVIQSTPTETGSFIDNGTITVAGAGSVAVERDMSVTLNHIISPPVSNQDIASFKTAYSIASLYDYVQDNGPWTSSLDPSFIPGKGYVFHRSNVAVAAKFVGSPVSGDQSYNVARGATGRGWNCIGNPFTATISAKGGTGLLTLNSAQLDPSFAGLYVWDEQPGYTGTEINYRVICNVPYTFPAGITELSQNYLQVGQGFFIKSKSGGGSISIPTSLRSHQNTEVFKSAEISWPAIKLIANGTNRSSSTIIAFNSNMTKGLDPTYDAGMLKGNPDFALYSRLVEDNGVDFAVQSLPTMDIGQYIIPVGIDNKDGGRITFTAQTVNLPAGLQVTLQDKFTQTNTRLDLKDASYTATIAPNTKGTGRFFLITDEKMSGNNGILQGDNILNVNDLHPEDLKIYTIGKTIYIQGEVSSDAKFALYSIDGKLLYNFKAGWSNQNELDASSFPSRTYILTVTENNKRKSAKFILGE